MPGLFAGLEVGKRALLTHQAYLQTIGHNIANVNTPGYSRQRVLISATMPEESAVGLLGTGIQVDDIRHIRDDFLSKQYRDATKSLGEWNYKEKTLSQIEVMFNEPSESSLNSFLDKFWDAWSQLSTNSDSTSYREVVINEAEQLVHGFHQLATDLNDLRTAVDQDLETMVTEVNRLTGEIARLNKHIQSAELDGSQAADIRDKRDLLTDQLADLIDVQVREKPNGATMVSMGAMILVDGTDHLTIDTVDTASSNGAVSELIWTNTNVHLRNLGGQLHGLVDARDKIIPDLLAQLDEMARTLVEEVNAVHMSAYGLKNTTGVAFFDPGGTTAAGIRLNTEILTDPSRVAAAATDAGDNGSALAMAELRNTAVMNGSTLTINNYYDGLVGKLGIDSHEAKSFTQNFELLANQVDNARQSVQGVSLDEEMANMIKFQHAYDAAARVITAMDQALDTVITQMGVVGR